MDNGNFIIRVKDDGVGMTPEQIQNVMADQFIISSANIDNRKGNGLGYLIIKDLLKMMGASILISSEKGKGTTVSLTIPSTNTK
jgi:signal transduction histidine kinase